MSDEDKIKLTINGYDQIANMWDGTRRSDWPEVTSIIHSAILDLPNRSQIIDIGCGNARILDEISDIVISKEDNYLGIDTSKNLLQIAKNRYAHIHFAEFEVFDGINLNIIKNIKYDLLISTAVLHHIPKGLQVNWLSQFTKLIKDDSKIIITVWHRSRDAQNFEIQKEEIEGFAQLENIRYIYNFEKEELEDLFKSCGLSILDFKELKRPNSNNANWVFTLQKVVS